MFPKNINDIPGWFQVLHTTSLSQAATMILPPGAESGPEPHPLSDQVLLVTEGTVQGTIGDESVTLYPSEFITIPANTQHRFWNEGDVRAVTFNVYANPVYPAGEAE